MIFKIYNCDIGVKVGVVSYNFPDVNSITVTDPERNSLTRGANAQNKIGLAFSEGLKEPKMWETTPLNLSAALHGVLATAFKEKTRLEVYAIDRTDGSSKMLKNALLANYPMQASLAEGADSMEVALTFVSFDNSENHKS